MKKRFNVTGTCIPEKHFMVDTSHKLEKVMELIEDEEYFTINRPRQYGKTTTMFLLSRILNKSNDYLCIRLSFEGISSASYKTEELFVEAFISQLNRYLNFNKIDFIKQILEKKKIYKMNDIDSFITEVAESTSKKIVLMIDEVDKSSNNQLFLDFLGMLRNKYLLRNEGLDCTFHSIVLAGVHDVKSLKLKLRPGEEEKYNSPWNIATDFNLDMSFLPKEIATMLDDYIGNKGVKLDKEYFAEKLYYYTSGYPFLVSKLCKIIDERIMPKDELVWRKEYMDIAIKEILKDSNTNFDSLIKNIQNNNSLKELVKKIVIDGNEIAYNLDNPVTMLGSIYGIFKNSNGRVKINNRIYEQRIYAYMASLLETSLDMGFYNERSRFIKEDGSLDIKKILTKFQEFMKKENSYKRKAFLEADGRLVFLAFISPIINGIGFAFKEVQGAEERRFDIVITYEKKMYIIELKKWYGEEYHKKGLLQLGEYLEQHGMDEGYLLVFDFRKEKSIVGDVKEEQITINEKSKKIYGVFC